ncbi:unnamed protein product [Danaus chrysippus]|uniref:(African queen) hypothetical protein n=1 Tax=Danaus chrysippus TaxID=151541 RepID=A0A8J2R3Q3_9NEOP|nr:unnamed protein product [Danaus chrysippus]
MTIDPSSLHERLVDHVRAVSGEPNSQTGVWGEHSYARPRGVAPDPLIRTLLAPRPSSPDEGDVLDVEGGPTSPPGLPMDDDHSRDSEENDCNEDEEDWEIRVTGLAPTAGHARLVGDVADVLRGLRLERLAGRGGRWGRTDGARDAARRVRRVLASHWTSGAAAWLHAALSGGLPPPMRRYYDEVLAELWRTVPRLAERLGAPRPQALQHDPLALVGERRPASEPGPWLAWAPSGSNTEDARWVRRLGALLHVRELVPGAPHAPGLAPDRWCASLAHEARTALSDLLAEAGRRPVLLGGAGAGAALCSWLAAGGAGARLRGLLLLAPPLLTAEGPRDSAEEPADEPDLPLLVVSGTAGAACWRGAAAELCVCGSRAACRRLLVVSGADDRLLLPRAYRRLLRVPQQSVDAAVCEECARWSLDVAESPPRERSRRKVGEEDRGTQSGRSIEIVEGRVVQRGSGAALELQPPRRVKRPERSGQAGEGPGGEEALAAADIMQLPIVFADDEPPAPPALTVTSGAPRAVRYTRVIVAKKTARRRHKPHEH